MILKSENQVCSFKYSQELEKLGIKQESIFWWRKYSLCKNTDLYYIPNKETDLLILSGKLEYNYSAFTVGELYELMPYHIEVHKWKGNNSKFRYEIDYHISDNCKHNLSNENLANGLAEMFIYLLKNKIIKL
jgi:hypothetical protein